MANKSSSNNKNTESKQTKKKSSSGGSVWSLNKISFYTICAAAIIYLVSIILAAIGGNLAFVAQIFQNIASAIMVCIVAVNAWRYVKSKPTIWKVLYFIVLLVIIVGIIIPLVL